MDKYIKNVYALNSRNELFNQTKINTLFSKRSQSPTPFLTTNIDRVRQTTKKTIVFSYNHLKPPQKSVSPMSSKF